MAERREICRAAMPRSWQGYVEWAGDCRRPPGHQGRHVVADTGEGPYGRLSRYPCIRAHWQQEADRG